MAKQFAVGSVWFLAALSTVVFAGLVISRLRGTARVQAVNFMVSTAALLVIGAVAKGYDILLVLLVLIAGYGGMLLGSGLKPELIFLVALGSDELPKGNSIMFQIRVVAGIGVAGAGALVLANWLGVLFFSQ